MGCMSYAFVYVSVVPTVTRHNRTKAQKQLPTEKVWLNITNEVDYYYPYPIYPLPKFIT